MADAQQFIDALRTLEETRDVEPIAALFAADAAVANPLGEHKGGPEAAKAFWTTYRGTFDSIRSEFRETIQSDGVAMLEWTSNGSIDGQDVVYGGVSVLTFGEGGITAFRSYFDPTKISRIVPTRD